MTVTETWGHITDEELARMAKRIGTYRHPEPHWRDATRDAFRVFARGIGDRNPLFQDEDYAAKTRWERLTAFPTFLYSYTRLEGFGGGLPGVSATMAADSWYFYQPVRVGDVIRAKEALWDQRLVPSRHAGRMVNQVNRTAYVNDRAEVVADQYTLVKRWERQSTYETGTMPAQQRYGDWKRHVYSEDEIRKIWDEYATTEIRGAVPLFWEDVTVGEKLPTIVKGPYTAREVVAFYMGAGAPLMMASDVMWAYFRRHPAIIVPDKETNTPDVPERIHIEADLAKRFGAPDMYDVTHQRLSWGANLITNWMGDDAFLRECSCIARRFNCYGETTWVAGAVTKKWRDGQENLIRVDFTFDSQYHRHAWGHAVVALPSRERGPVVLPAPTYDPEGQPTTPLTDYQLSVLSGTEPI